MTKSDQAAEEALPIGVRKQLADIRANLAKAQASYAAQTAEELENLMTLEKIRDTKGKIADNIAAIENQLAQALKSAGLIP